MPIKPTVSSITIPIIFQHIGINSPLILLLVIITHFLTYSYLPLSPAESLWCSKHPFVSVIHTLAPLPHLHTGLEKPPSWQWMVAGEIHTIMLNSTIYSHNHDYYSWHSILVSFTVPLFWKALILPLLFSNLQNLLPFLTTATWRELPKSCLPAYVHLIPQGLLTLFPGCAVPVWHNAKPSRTAQDLWMLQ